MNPIDEIYNFSIIFPVIKLFTLVVIAWVSFFFCRYYLVRLMHFLINGLSGYWVQIFSDTQFLSKVSWFLPVALVQLGSSMIDGLSDGVITIIQRVSTAMMVVLGLLAICRLLNKVNEVYSTLDVAKNRPIKGIIQVCIILLHAMALILVFAVLLDKSPLVFLSGLGAMTAILLLIFRDTILSRVAGLQLTTNDLVRVGDWIEVPQFGADGAVIDMALHAVQVQNWDKTITSIPTHKFLENSFKNWRGMQESGGRRIKRSIFIDMNSIHFLNQDEIDNFSRFALLKDYIEQKKSELYEHNKNYQNNPELLVNARRLTNIGTFRKYLDAYLRQNPNIHKDLTFLVRQLAPGPTGLPIEIYVFTNDVRWVNYEAIQADIFDHVLAILPEFNLRAYQNPSGGDIKSGVESFLFKDNLKKLESLSN